MCIRDRFYETFGDQLDDLFLQVEADPRIVAATTEISACVADRGLVFDGDMSSVYERFSQRVSQIGGGNPFGEDPFAEAGLDPETMTEDEINDFFENLGPPRLSAEDAALLGEIQAEEIELALAVNDCGGGPRDMNGLFNEVRIEIEREFLANNAEALEAFAGN